MKNFRYIFLSFLVFSAFCFGGTSKDSLFVSSKSGTKSAVGVWWSANQGSSKSSKKPSPVAVWFHGGMSSGNCEKGLVAGNDLSELLPHYTVISASACRENHWVTPAATEWIDTALDSVAARRKQPVDTVYLIGVSDGALGVFAYSMWGRRRIETRVLISSYGAMLGAASDLARIPQLQSGRWCFFQGGQDRLYPSEQTKPWIETFCRGMETSRTKCDLIYDSQGEHDWSYWKKMHKKSILELFL